jgi:hypothetical protein
VVLASTLNPFKALRPASEKPAHDRIHELKYELAFPTPRVEGHGAAGLRDQRLENADGAPRLK